VKAAPPSRSIQLGVQPQEVWDLLVAPGKRDWYYWLTPEGDFAPGGRIRWNDATGKLNEESEVVEATAPRRRVGSVACVVIAAPYRGHGIASRLLDEAVDRLRARGMRAVEAYPHRGADSAQTTYRGPLTMLLRAGFEPYRETERNTVLRKML